MKSSCYGASVFFIVIFAVALAGCAGTLPSNSTNEDRTPAIDGLPPKISALFQKTKTVCFGRFMIDLPESATIAWGTAAVPYDIEVYPKEGYKIKSQIKAKVDEITEEQHTEEPSMLIGVFDSVNPESKIVVGYESRHNTRGANFYSYIRLGDTAFVQESVSVPLVVGDKSARLGIREDKTLYKKDVEELSDIARRLRLRTENEIPDEQGVCIEEAFIAWPLDFCFERVQIGFYFPEVPDVNLSIQTTSTKKPSEDDTLEAGLRESRAMATESGLGGLFSRITTLRKGKRNIGKWEGAEALMRMPSNGATPETHEFFFVSPGVGEDMLRPRTRVAMYTGVKDEARGQAQPSLTDKEAMALWDKLTSTIRVRPTR